MTSEKLDRGASGYGSIVFRQRLDQPTGANQITYYPPEPSPALKKQVSRDKIGGITVYIIGFVVAFIGFIIAFNDNSVIQIYELLIPLLLIIGLIAAIMYLVMNNVALAKLSRTLPLILIICMVMLYIYSILNSITGLADIDDIDDMGNAIDNVFSSILSPAFFLILTGLIVARAGGTMLWTSTKVLHEYIPGMIIMEVPAGAGLPEDRYCDTCKGRQTYIEEYDRWYCYTCKDYKDTVAQPVAVEVAPSPAVVAAAPIPTSEGEPIAIEEDRRCEKCNDQLVWVDQHERWYCYTCKEYAPLDDVADADDEPDDADVDDAGDDEPDDASNCKTCGGELTYIEQYGRYYCYKCKAYD